MCNRIGIPNKDPILNDKPIAPRSSLHEMCIHDTAGVNRAL
jgi:hypothetical protein